MVKYDKSPSVIPTEKNIAEANPLEVEIESNARVPGPGVTAKINRVKPRTKKIFTSIIIFSPSLPKRNHIFYLQVVKNNESHNSHYNSNSIINSDHFTKENCT